MKGAWHYRQLFSDFFLYVKKHKNNLNPTNLIAIIFYIIMFSQLLYIYVRTIELCTTNLGSNNSNNQCRSLDVVLEINSISGQSQPACPSQCFWLPWCELSSWLNNSFKQICVIINAAVHCELLSSIIKASCKYYIRNFYYWLCLLNNTIL